jgi:hypothetical protein
LKIEPVFFQGLGWLLLLFQSTSGNNMNALETVVLHRVCFPRVSDRLTYDLAAEANAQGGMVLNSRYGKPILLQNARTLRLGVKFTF